MTKCLVIGDPHFKINNGHKTAEMTKAVILIANEIKPDFIVNLGDTLDRHANIHVDPLCDAVNFIHQLSLIAPVYMLIGNHDRRNNSEYLTEIHPFTAIKHFSSRV